MYIYRFCGLLILICILTNSPQASAQVNRNVGFELNAYALTQAKVETKPGIILENATVLIRDGLIEGVGVGLKIPADAEVIDCKGMQIYAGFIDAASSALINKDIKKPKPDERKVDFGRYALAATRPDNRNYLSPHSRANQAVTNKKNSFTPYQKSGFTSVHILPQGQVASGQGALLSTSEFPVRESTLIGSTMSSFRLFAPKGDVYPKTLMGAVAHLRQTFLDANHYEQHWDLYHDQSAFIKRPPTDPAYVACLQTLHGRQIPVFAANSRDEILRTLDFCSEFKLKPVIWGGAEAHLCLDRLKADSRGVICKLDFSEKPKVEDIAEKKELSTEIQEPLRVQREKLKLWHDRIQGLSQLADRGLPVSLSSESLKNSVTDLIPQLRIAVEEGLSAKQALRFLTIDAAKLLGIDQRLGTVEKGKLAHLVVMTGPWEKTDTKIRYLFVDGVYFEYKDPSESEQEKSPETISSNKAQSVKINLAGDWGVEIQSAQGKVIGQLHLSQEKEKLRGTFSSEKGDGKITAGTINKNNYEFTVAIGAGGHSIELRFKGSLGKETRPDRISGSLKSAFGTKTSWSAVRKVEKSKQSSGNPILLSIEGTDEDPKLLGESVSGSLVAKKPDLTDKQQSSKDGHHFKTELESDRVRRFLKTDGNLLLKNGTVITVTGEILKNTSILVKKGKISAIGKTFLVPTNVVEIDATGLYVMPGIIDTHSHIMITDGINESSQSIVPEVRIKDVVNTSDPAEYRALAGGVTTARLFHGSANVIGGQDAVVKLKYGKTAREHILQDAPQGVKFALGENVKWQTARFPNTRMGVEATLQRAFLEAIDYRRQWQEYEKIKKTRGKNKQLPPRRDLRLEALADIVNHDKFIHSHCYRADEILMLLRVASHLGIRVWSLQHVLEGYKVAPEILAHGASCSTFSDWWAYKIEAFDAVPHNAALLNEAGVNTVIKSDDRELIRHLYLEAAKTVRYGNMSFNEALRTITINPARELGLDQRIGSIEIGKDADFAIFNGHPLNAYSRCEMTIVDGEVCFDRKKQPTAMLNSAEQRSHSPKVQIAQRKTASISFPGDGVKEYAIVGATLHPVDGEDISDGMIVIKGTKIDYVGLEKTLPENIMIINAKNLHVYPGMIDSGSTLGLTEIDKVRETRDYSESGDLQPDLRTGVAINPDSELFPVARAGGITSVLVCPRNGLIAGQASLVQTAGWTAPEMVMDLEAGLQIIWSTKEERQQELADFLKKARLYLKLKKQTKKSTQNRPVTDPRYEALIPYLTQKKPVFIEANSQKEIVGALLFIEKEELKAIITGGTDAWKLTSELKARKVSVIVGPVMKRPQENYDPFDAPYANAGHLYEAGVPFCIRSNSAWNSRNAPFEAAMAVAYGLPEQAALRAITLSAAEILGVEKQIGSLTEGKLANLIIADGSPLQHTSHIKAVCVSGKLLRPESKQTRLYERYRSRLLKLQNPSNNKSSAPVPLETKKSEPAKKPANTK
ncbi:MAG: amidohydrolase family protein [Planctomycetes bacterium]|nr:amidohydrolase family protein [Planctomycetota bacterium]MCH9726447.1 amidohydrolase family protein [Planctomycetota bacterium]MCH9778256.1 amidohydrolase family protein [Planctomycetota bacterium]MCH9793054.1 amidohydrolase family protein [Planctomycetota bacterium]